MLQSLQETNGDLGLGPTEHETTSTLQSADFSDRISYAFQLATAKGPLCNEPVQGIAVFLEEVTIKHGSSHEEASRDSSARLIGEVLKTVRESIHQGFLDWSPRILLAMYSCEIQAARELCPFIIHCHVSVLQVPDVPSPFL